MHDPMTVAFEIKYPWKRKSSLLGGYRETFITIWHVDPETDGSDDSCGWFSPKLTKEELNSIRKETPDLVKHLFGADGDRLYPIVDPLSAVIACFSTLSWRLYRKSLSPKELAEVINLGTNLFDNFRGSFERESTRYNDFERTLFFMTRSLKRMRRQWWKHPRWHLHHWKIQIHPLQAFKRWAFTKCASCGKGFKWGESCWTNSWHSEGPSWFRSEKDLHHDNCSGHSVQKGQGSEVTQ